jgi:predicted PurR-regulated permease PerM
MVNTSSSFTARVSAGHYTAERDDSPRAATPPAARPPPNWKCGAVRCYTPATHNGNRTVAEPTKDLETPAKTAEQAAGDLLDAADTAVMFRSSIEAGWESRQNTILDRHPYLAGYAFIAGLLTVIFATHLTTFAILFLFLYLISDFLTNDVRRYIRFVPKALLFSVLYLAVIALLTVLSYKVIPRFIQQLPELADQLQTQALTQFEYVSQQWNLPEYVDPQEVRGTIVSATTKTIGYLAKGFQSFYTGFIYFIFALVINLLLYHNPEKIDAVFARRPESLMYFFYRFTILRVRVFYFYFKRVMGGQIIISAINTAISTIVIVGLGLPHPVLLISAVFFCGLFPVVGNLVSNTILTITAFVTIGAWGAAICLGLLVGIHKLEYFLNSKIIGDIVHLPMVVTLTALIVSEVLLGVIGLMLAIPLVLYIRHELDHIPGLSAAKKDMIEAGAAQLKKK